MSPAVPAVSNDAGISRRASEVRGVAAAAGGARVAASSDGDPPRGRRGRGRRRDAPRGARGCRRDGPGRSLLVDWGHERSDDTRARARAVDHGPDVSRAHSLAPARRGSDDRVPLRVQRAPLAHVLRRQPFPVDASRLAQAAEREVGLAAPHQAGPMVRVVALGGEQLALHVINAVPLALGACQGRVAHRAELVEPGDLDAAAWGPAHGTHRGGGAEGEALGRHERGAHRARERRRGRRGRGFIVPIRAARRPRRRGRALDHAAPRVETDATHETTTKRTFISWVVPPK